MKVELVCSVSPIPGQRGAGRGSAARKLAEEGRGEC